MGTMSRGVGRPRPARSCAACGRPVVATKCSNVRVSATKVGNMRHAHAVTRDFHGEVAHERHNPTVGRTQDRLPRRGEAAVSEAKPRIVPPCFASCGTEAKQSC